MTVSPEDFVRAWQAAESPADVAAQLGLSLNTVTSRATYYRKKGVRLKRFSKNFRNINVEALNVIIQESGQKPPPPASPS